MCTSLKGGTCLRFYTKVSKAFALKCAPRFYQHCCYVQSVASLCCQFLPFHLDVLSWYILKFTKIIIMVLYKLKYLLAGAASRLCRLCKTI